MVLLWYRNGIAGILLFIHSEGTDLGLGYFFYFFFKQCTKQIPLNTLRGQEILHMYQLHIAYKFYA